MVIQLYTCISSYSMEYLFQGSRMPRSTPQHHYYCIDLISFYTQPAYKLYLVYYIVKCKYNTRSMSYGIFFFEKPPLSHHHYHQKIIISFVKRYSSVIYMNKQMYDNRIYKTHILQINRRKYILTQEISRTSTHIHTHPPTYRRKT